MYEMDDAEVEAVRRVISSRKLFRYRANEASECDLFEREFAEKIGSQHAILLSSGTNALLASLVAAGVGPGDEVLVPAYTFVATAAAVVLAGAKPVVVNIDGTLGMCPLDASARITPKTKAILPVHMDGLPANLAALTALATEHRLIVIEDCAQAIGGSFKGRRLGTWGDLGAFSLNENKTISCGEGGIVVTSNKEFYQAAFCAHDLAVRYNPTRKTIFDNPPAFLGMSMRVSDIQGAIMRVQLTRLDSILTRLRERKRILIDHLEVVEHIKIVPRNCVDGDCASSVHLSFADPARAAFASRHLMKQGLVAMFPTARPAHVAWKWIEQIAPGETQLLLSELLPSIDVLTRVLKIDVDPALPLDETARMGEKLRAALAES